MRRPLIKRTTRELITGILLVVLAFRAFIPVGFMPAGDGPFVLQICRGGSLTTIDPHELNQQPGNHANFEHCPYGSAPANGPIAQLALHIPVRASPGQPAPRIESRQTDARRQRAHQPRAPPLPA